METQRLFLFLALSLVVLMLWEAWQRDYGPAPEEVVQQAPAVVQTQGQATPDAQAVPGIGSEDLPSAPAGAPLAAAEQLQSTGALATGERIEVLTDVYRIEIDTVGGDIRRVDLLDYPVEVDKPEVPFQLMNDTLPNLFVVQSGLRSGDGVEPTHHVRYQAGQPRYQLAEGSEILEVPLYWDSGDGLRVTKLYRFQRGKYKVDLEHKVENLRDVAWTGRQYRQLQRTQVAEFGQSQFIYTYMGGVLYSPEEKYEKIGFDDMVDSDLSRDVTQGWAAMIQHYFVGAIVPQATETNRYYTKTLQGARYVIGAISPGAVVPAGGNHTFSTALFIGPKLQKEMEKIAEGLELTVDYGVLTVLAKPLYWLLNKIYWVVGNWGWAIILLTVLIKLAFYKLSETSYRSMAQMRKLAPRLQALKERFGDDKQGLNQAMMDLYKTEKINPLGGCLPILVQIPVFIALYWVLLETVELRQAPFILWIQDMSQKDPYFVLPVIFAVTTFIQQKLHPAPLDPIQAKVMMIMPIAFAGLFAFFPAGLVLYWVTNNVLSIAQQWMINKRVEQAG